MYKTGRRIGNQSLWHTDDETGIHIPSTFESPGPHQVFWRRTDKMVALLFYLVELQLLPTFVCDDVWINLLIDRPLLKMSFEELDRTSFLSCTLLTLLEKPAVQTLSRLNKESPL